MRAWLARSAASEDERVALLEEVVHRAGLEMSYGKMSVANLKALCELNGQLKKGDKDEVCVFVCTRAGSPALSLPPSRLFCLGGRSEAARRLPLPGGRQGGRWQDVRCAASLLRMRRRAASGRLQEQVRPRRAGQGARAAFK